MFNNSPLKQWFMLTPNERWVLIILVMLITCAICIPYLYPNKPAKIAHLDQLNTELAQLKIDLDSQVEEQKKVKTANYFQPKVRKNLQKEPKQKAEYFIFDPNTIDSTDFLRLGFSPKQTAVLLRFRNKRPFRSVEDFNKMYVVSDQMQKALNDYIRIEQKEIEFVSKGAVLIKDRTTLSLDINRADTNKLVLLKGIGPYYAAKIVAYRQQLGGFYTAQQLLEIKGIDEERFALFAPMIKVDTASIRKININEVSEFELRKHPYIAPHLAKSILTYREYKGKLSTIEELVNHKVITAKENSRLKWYFSFK